MRCLAYPRQSHADRVSAKTRVYSVLKIFAPRVRSFQLCGYTGFLLSFAQSLVLVRHLGLSQLTLLGITGTVILTFYVLMMVTKILANGEVIIYYHHEIAVIATSALFLRLTKQSVLPYLDVLVLGLGVFLACGRIGCLMVGCCHGRPCRWGVCYGSDHAEAGFPRDLVGVKLFPIQAVESALALCIVIAGWRLLLGRHEPGSVLVWYVIAYGCARFCLEFFRGDAARPYLWGFSEAQWTSLLLTLAIAIAERTKILPPSRWHWVAAMAMGVSMVLIGTWRRFDGSHSFELLHPRHVREIICAVAQLELFSRRAAPDSELSTSSEGIHVAQTSLGCRISAGRSMIGSRTIKHYSLSKDGGFLSLRAAQILSLLLTRLEANSNSFKLIQGRTGVFHILLQSSRDYLQPHTQNTKNPGARLLR